MRIRDHLDLNGAHFFGHLVFIGNVVGACIGFVINCMFMFNSDISMTKSVPCVVFVIMSCDYLAYSLSQTAEKIEDQTYYIWELLERKNKLFKEGANAAGDEIAYRTGIKDQELFKKNLLSFVI